MNLENMGQEKAQSSIPESNGILRRRKPSSTKITPPTPVPVPDTWVPLSPPPSVPESKGLTVPPEHAHRSQIAQTWILSRLISSDPVQYRKEGEERPVTLANIRLAIQLVLLMWRDILDLFFKDHRWRMGMYFGCKMARGTLPALKIWASSSMLDMVQRSFESGGVDQGEVVRIALINLLFHAGNDIFRFFSQSNDSFIQERINYMFEKSHFRTQLSLSIPTLSSEYASAIVYEAGVMAGIEYRLDSKGHQWSQDPFQALDGGLLQIPTLLVAVITQLLLLLRTIRAGSDMLTWSSLVLISLSLAPSLLRIGGSWAGIILNRRDQGKDMREIMARYRAVRDLGKNGGYKQEVVLFGLKDWVMDKWEHAREIRTKAQRERRSKMGVTELALDMSQEGVQTGFYVLLASKILATSLSLGSIRLYQSTASGLLRSLQSFTNVLGVVFQTIFYLAAFIETRDLPDHPEKLLPPSQIIGPLISYESTREGDGMSIEAINLGFTYPGASKPTLHNINLAIPAGQTLAIVGFNGGGKTTLVKALMGLYQHTGTLKINGLESSTLDGPSIHHRTSCLFQDFSKYGLTLRENVGVGNVKHLQDDTAIHRAIERGDAGGVRDKVGLDGLLNRFGVPDKLEAEANASTESVSEKKGEKAIGTSTSPDARGPENHTPEKEAHGRGQLPGTSHPDKDLRDSPKAKETVASPPDPAVFDGLNGADKAVSLSGGQWQRVALSRAFLRADEADLVVFDEPSAALDPKAESELFQRIHALSHSGGRKTTTIYISHRFSTVRKADQIAVVEEGTITELGSHAELLALGERYHELYNIQKEGFIDD